MSPQVEAVYDTVGDCPKCGAPTASYKYTVRGPFGDERENVEIEVSIKCDMCGYSDTKKIIFPVKALWLVKYLLVPEVRPYVEKLYLLHKVRIVEGEEDS